MKKRIGKSELKQIQLEILKSIDDFCRSNNLKYFLAYGTLLGAVRHKGYIPWDDDIDILMFREDYEKFISMYKDKNYKVFSTELERKYPYPFVKVGDTRTYFEEEIKDSIDTGVNIDIFPMDYLPKDKINSLRKKRDFLEKIWTLKRLPRLKRRGVLKNLILSITQLLLSLTSVHSIVRELENNAKKYKLKESSICGNIAFGGASDIYQSSWFYDQIELLFEGYTFPCPKEYNNVLNVMYGDYMKLPPKEKQVSHHHFIAYWK